MARTRAPAVRARARTESLPAVGHGHRVTVATWLSAFAGPPVPLITFWSVPVPPSETDVMCVNVTPSACGTSNDRSATNDESTSKKQ